MNRTNVLRRNVLLAGTFAFAAFSGAPVWAASVTITDPNCTSFTTSGSGSNLSITCAATTPPSVSGPPTGCSLMPSVSTVTAGTKVWLTASCTGGSPVKGYSWSNPQGVATNVATTQVTVDATTTYRVTMSNDDGAVESTATVTVQAAPPPPPAGTLSCPGFASTKVIDAPIPAPGTSVRYFTSSSTVKHFLDLVGNDGGVLLRDVVVASIGPITAETAARQGIVSHVVPESYTIPALADALVRHFQAARPTSGPE
jgi:hypothetical protein